MNHYLLKCYTDIINNITVYLYVDNINSLNKQKNNIQSNTQKSNKLFLENIYILFTNIKENIYEKISKNTSLNQTSIIFDNIYNCVDISNNYD